MKEPSNRERADWANTALEVFAAEIGMEGTEERDLLISDLLSDLMHLCDIEEIDLSACFDRAYGHYCEELHEEKRRAKACLDQGSSKADQ